MTYLVINDSGIWKEGRYLMQKGRDRLFLAVPAILFDYAKLQSDFSGLVEGRWTVVDNLHLTLCFFGDRFGRRELLNRLEPLIQSIDPVEIRGVGFFKHNRILHAKAESSSLEKMHFRIAREFGLPVKRGFAGHITLMRVKKIHDMEMFRQEIHNYNSRVVGRLDPWLELMQSRLYSDGARYELVKRFSRSLSD